MTHVPIQPEKAEQMPIPSPFTNKHAAAWAASLIACLAGLGTVHAQFVVPSILRQVDKMIDAELDRHTALPLHEGAVSRREYSGDAADMKEALGQINVSLGKIDDRLRALETK